MFFFVLTNFIVSFNSSLNGCSLEQEGEDFFIVGADSVRKKLGSGATIGTTICFTSAQNPIIDFTATDDCIFVISTYAYDFTNVSVTDTELITKITSTSSSSYSVCSRVYKVKKGGKVYAYTFANDIYYSALGIEIK